MIISIKKQINAPIQNAWEIMGNQFGHAHLWSSNFHDSKPGGPAKFEGISYSHRDTQTERGNTIQELTAFDPMNHSLSYVITAGAPEIAKEAGATWSLRSTENGTEVQMDFHLEPKMELPAEMEQKIQMGLSKSVEELAAEFKHYVETGEALINA